MNAGGWVHPCAVALVLAGCGEFEMPPSIASSKYIDYHTDVDASVICMDDLLASEDRFIERAAALLGVDPPSDTIDFIWDPMQDGSEPWSCKGTAPACFKARSGDDLSVVVSRDMTQHHELVHAVEYQALGTGHVVLREGAAEYLGSLKVSTYPPGDFPGRFKAILAAKPTTTSDYRLTMHFVGSIFKRHGAEKYRALRARMPESAGPEEFAEVFAAEFGRSLDDALVEMGSEIVYGNDLFSWCGEGEAPRLEWTGEGVLDRTIEGACGDRGFFGAGFVAGRPGFYATYQVEVSQAGKYELTIGGIDDGSTRPSGALVGCFFGSGAVGAPGGTGQGLLLEPGGFLLVMRYPAAPEPRGAATVRLEYLGPLP